MVHSVGSVKMAVMARQLSAGGLSQNMTEEAARQKRVSYYIHQQLREADEANLLDERDMHVFDLKPMTDTLYLVCCNACKKPIKASQYAAHAELCRSLMSTGEFLSDLSGDTGPKRPPKMERKRSKAAGMSPTVAQERCEKVDPSDAALSRFYLMGHNGPMSSVIADTKDGPRHTNSSSTHENCLASSNVKDTSAAAGIMPLPKRPKLLAADILQCSKGIATGRDGCKVSSSRSSLTHVPAPLATKTYYSRRNNILRAALSYMYHKGATIPCSDEASPKVSEGSFIPSEVNSSRILSEEQLIKQAQEKSITYNLPSSPNSNQRIDGRSGVVFSQMGDHQPMNSCPNQPGANDAFPSQTSHVEMKTSLYSSKPYPLTSNPGAPMTPVEQPDGSVAAV